MNSCFIKYNAPLNKYVIVAQNLKIFRKKLLVFCVFKVHFRMFQIFVFSVEVYANIYPVCICLVAYTYLSLNIV